MYNNVFNYVCRFYKLLYVVWEKFTIEYFHVKFVRGKIFSSWVADIIFLTMNYFIALLLNYSSYALCAFCVVASVPHHSIVYYMCKHMNAYKHLWSHNGI